MLVQDGIADAFRDAVPRAGRADPPGRPARRGRPTSAPASSRTHFERVRRASSSGRRADGATSRLRRRAATPTYGDRRHYYRPTLSSTRRPASEILTPGGLRPGAHHAALRHRGGGRRAWPTAPSSASPPRVVTGDRGPRRARHRHGCVAGTVWVNCFFVRDLSAPFGGSGQSGIGREGGAWSFDFYCDVKNTVFAPTADGSDAMGEVVGAGLLVARPDHHAAAGDPAGAQRGQGDLPGPGAARSCARRCSRPSTTTPSSCSTRTGSPPWSSSSPRRTAAPACSPPRSCPRGMCRIPYDWRGDPELAHAIADAGRRRTAPGSRRSTTSTCRSTTRPSTSGSTSARASTSSGSR